METNWNKPGNTNSKIQELTVLQSELSSLGKNALVYRQQKNSSIMFKCKKANVLSDVKKELNELQKEKTGKT